MADLTGEALARELGRLLSENQALRLAPNGILALLGNAGHESQNFSRAIQNPRVAGGNPGPGRGLFQWDDRRPLLDAWMAQNGYFPGDYMNPAVNAGFAAHELLGGEGRKKTYIIPGFGSMSLLEALRNPNISAAELSDVVHRTYERSADVGNETFTSAPARQEWAQRAGDIYAREGWGSPYTSGNWYGDMNASARGLEPPKDPLRPAVFDDINTMLPDIPGIPSDLPDTPGIDTPQTLERLAGFYSSEPSNTGSRYDVTPELARDPYRAPTPPPPNLPGWENRAADEAAGRVASAQTLADFRRDQANRAAGGLVWNGRDWVEGGTWTGREYVPPAPAASEINGFPTPTTGWPTAAPPEWTPPEWIPPTWTPAPVPDVSFVPTGQFGSPSGPLLAPQPVVTPVFDPVVPSFGNPLYQLHNTTIGGSGVSPTTVGPSGVANPFAPSPNFMPEPVSGVGGGSSDVMTLTVRSPNGWEY